MSINQKGIDLIKSFEDLRLEAYRCKAGVLTIGYGHTGSDVKEGMVITPEQAEKLLQDDLFYVTKRVNTFLVEKRIRRFVNENQFAALVSLAFNIGVRAFRDSTVYNRIWHLNFPEAAEAFMMWVKVKDKVSNGLTRRREAERELFLTPV